MKPLAIDLFCGKGGWTQGLQACGYHVVGFDIADMGGYPGELVLQDVLTIYGSQFRAATLIVASPPCQKYSYMAMPWSRSKELAKWYRESDHPERIVELNALFDACFRIQLEASEAAGRHIPMVLENVKGAQPWVGPAKAHYGSFYLWGSIESVGGRIVKSGPVKFGQLSLCGGKQILKVPGFNFHQYEKTGQPGGSFQSAAVEGIKVPGLDWSGSDKSGCKAQAFNTTAEKRIRKGNNPDGGGVKNGADWFGSGVNCSEQRKHASRSSARKEASARIAMIPLPLAKHIGQVFHP